MSFYVPSPSCTFSMKVTTETVILMWNSCAGAALVPMQMIMIIHTALLQKGKKINHYLANAHWRMKFRVSLKSHSLLVFLVICHYLVVNMQISFYKLIVNGSYKLVPFYSCFITIICNVSPNWRSMSLVAAVTLVNLFKLFSSPKFL